MAIAEFAIKCWVYILCDDDKFSLPFNKIYLKTKKNSIELVTKKKACFQEIQLNLICSKN